MTGTQAGHAGDQKMKELILYLATRSEDDPWFSSTKLNKLLFYCDFTAYRQLGQSITGHSYQKLQFGPAPKALLPILNEMKRDRDCMEIERDVYGRQQRRVQAERVPEVSSSRSRSNNTTNLPRQHKPHPADRRISSLQPWFRPSGAPEDQ